MQANSQAVLLSDSGLGVHEGAGSAGPPRRSIQSICISHAFLRNDRKARIQCNIRELAKACVCMHTSGPVWQAEFTFISN